MMHLTGDKKGFSIVSHITHLSMQYPYKFLKEYERVILNGAPRKQLHGAGDSGWSTFKVYEAVHAIQ